ncbi:hypothetical protein PanWU01x14_341160 [Parasponia andersonii]|uniref:Uncharacterized protein n=1 Tax=Parasponia andersonii TaxID=3476 RepID=A0A2P5AE91_PARAD|nr:hypothetical protein PanWU01x14_341160 [Parasponia andersonii]
MVARVDASTRIARIYDEHGNSVLIRKSSNIFKINLPTLFRKKVIVTDFKMATPSSGLMVRKSWSWEQNIGTGTRKGVHYDLNCLSAANCETVGRRIAIILGRPDDIDNGVFSGGGSSKEARGIPVAEGNNWPLVIFVKIFLQHIGHFPDGNDSRCLVKLSFVLPEMPLRRLIILHVLPTKK